MYLNDKGITNFSVFQNFMDVTFPDTPYYIQAQLFRDCYGVSNGNISSEVFITVANETNFFSGLLRLR